MGLLTSGGEAIGTFRLSNWLEINADGLGKRSVCELRSNYRRNC